MALNCDFVCRFDCQWGFADLELLVLSRLCIYRLVMMLGTIRIA